MHELKAALAKSPATCPRFLLPDGTWIRAHAHLTEVGYVVKDFIDCGGMIGKEEKVLQQTHVGDDTEHRLTSARFSKILELGKRVLPTADLNVEVEYDCCVVGHYPIGAVRKNGEYLEVRLERGRTQCRARERREAKLADTCCATSAAAACCE